MDWDISFSLYISGRKIEVARIWQAFLAGLPLMKSGDSALNKKNWPVREKSNQQREKFQINGNFLGEYFLPGFLVIAAGEQKNRGLAASA
jgi:hypothetical protein